VGGADRGVRAIAAVVGSTGWAALTSLALVMLGFYATCVVFVFGYSVRSSGSAPG